MAYVNGICNVCSEITLDIGQSFTIAYCTIAFVFYNQNHFDYEEIAIEVSYDIFRMA